METAPKISRDLNRALREGTLMISLWCIHLDIGAKTGEQRGEPRKARIYAIHIPNQ